MEKNEDKMLDVFIWQDLSLWVRVLLLGDSVYALSMTYSSDLWMLRNL